MPPGSSGRSALDHPPMPCCAGGAILPYCPVETETLGGSSMKWLWTTAAVVALAVGMVGPAQAQRRAAAASAAMPDVEIPHETFTLGNGLRVVVSTDRKAPVVAVGVWYGVGSRD